MADEIVGALAGKLITQKQVIDLIKIKPEKLDLILTGHHGKPSLFKYADLVTEMVSAIERLQRVSELWAKMLIFVQNVELQVLF